jgi:hypothetical protein
MHAHFVISLHFIKRCLSESPHHVVTFILEYWRAVSTFTRTSDNCTDQSQRHIPLRVRMNA